MTWFFTLSSVRLDDDDTRGSTAIIGSGFSQCRPAKDELPPGILMKLWNCRTHYLIIPSSASIILDDPREQELHQVAKGNKEKSLSSIRILEDGEFEAHCCVVLPQIRYDNIWKMSELMLMSCRHLTIQLNIGFLGVTIPIVKEFEAPSVEDFLNGKPTISNEINFQLVHEVTNHE